MALKIQKLSKVDLKRTVHGNRKEEYDEIAEAVSKLGDDDCVVIPLNGSNVSNRSMRIRVALASRGIAGRVRCNLTSDKKNIAVSFKK